MAGKGAFQCTSMFGLIVYVSAAVHNLGVNVEASYVHPSRQAKVQANRQRLSLASLAQKPMAEDDQDIIVHHYKTPAPNIRGKTPSFEEPLPPVAPIMKGKKDEWEEEQTGTKMSEVWVLIVVFILCVCLFIFLVYHICFKRRRGTRMSIAAAERTPITALREGEWAKVVGQVVPVQEVDMPGPNILRSPLQGITCVHFNVTTVTGGAEIARRHDCCNFYLQDETGGLVLIHATDVCAYHLKNVLQEKHSVEIMPEPCQRFLQNSRVQRSDDTIEPNVYEFEESVIPVGARVVAIGVCARMPRSGHLSLQSDTAVRKTLVQKGDEGLRRTLQDQVEKEDWQMMAAHVLLSDDPLLF